jgi:hypothetical protein
MLDEGGFLWITKEPERAKEALWAGQAGPLLLFGHAIAEHLVEKKPGKGMVVVLEGEGTPDELLAAALERPDWMMEPLPWPALRFSSEFPGSQS